MEILKAVRQEGTLSRISYPSAPATNTGRCPLWMKIQHKSEHGHRYSLIFGFSVSSQLMDVELFIAVLGKASYLCCSSRPTSAPTYAPILRGIASFLYPCQGSCHAVRQERLCKDPFCECVARRQEDDGMGFPRASFRLRSLADYCFGF